MRGYLCRLRTAEPTARPQPKSIWRCREGSCGQLRTQHRFGCPRTDPTTESYGCRSGQNRTPSSASSRSSGNVRDTRRWKVVATQRAPRSPPVRSTRTESRHEPSSSLVGSEVRNRSMASIPRAPAGSATAFARADADPARALPGPDRHVDPPGHRHARERWPWHWGRRSDSRRASGTEGRRITVPARRHRRGRSPCRRLRVEHRHCRSCCAMARSREFGVRLSRRLRGDPSI